MIIRKYGMGQGSALYFSSCTLESDFPCSYAALTRRVRNDMPQGSALLTSATFGVGVVCGDGMIFQKSDKYYNTEDYCQHIHSELYNKVTFSCPV